jgi:uncharacterized membrane protein
MIELIAGLILFLGMHSVQIVAPGWRGAMVARLGEGAWKGIHTLVSLAGIVLVAHGYGATRADAPLYALPGGLRHVTFLLVWVGFILVMAGNWPANHIRRALGHPMVAGVGLWALGHLLVRATPGALVMFGAFLVWSVVAFAALRQRGPAGGAAPRAINTVLVIVVGSVLGAVFVHLLHMRLIGVSPMG